LITSYNNSGIKAIKNGRQNLKKQRVGKKPLLTKQQPPYSPELQPAERLWLLVDEPLVNQNFETIDEIEEILVKRCNILLNLKQEIKDLTNYHWLNST
jgi:hypothetical protein